MGPPFGAVLGDITMDEISLASDLATIKANAQHTRDTLDKVNDKLDGLIGLKQSVSIYRKLTWFNLVGLLGAAGASIWPR